MNGDELINRSNASSIQSIELRVCSSSGDGGGGGDRVTKLQSNIDKQVIIIQCVHLSGGQRVISR